MRIALTAMVCAVALAACGSSGKPSTTAAASSSSQGLKLAACMRTHGVPNFPDSPGGGIKIPVGSGINPQSPAFESALSSCRHLLPGGGPGSGRPSAQAHAQLLKISECMRAHGVSDFPDPSSGAPPNPTSGAYSSVIGDGGYFLAIPSSIDTRAPAFKQAATACHFERP